MIKKCVNCPIKFDSKINSKYCVICRVLVRKQQNTRKKEFDMFCLDCNESLPINSKGDKMFCIKCRKIHQKRDQRNWYIRKTNKLTLFYKNIQYNLIQSPYFTDRKTLSSAILLENK